MGYRFITAAQVANFPAGDSRKAFLEYEEICSEAFTGFDREMDPEYSRENLNVAYMSCLSAAAWEFQIDEAEDLDPENFKETYNGPRWDFSRFEGVLQRIIAKMQIQVARMNQADLVVLPATSISKIEHHVSALRSRIVEADLPNARKAALNKKLDQLLAELEGKSFNLTKVMVIIASICTTVSQVEGVIIKLPDAITAISKSIGEISDLEQRLLPPPPKQLSFTPSKSRKGPRESFAADLDDEIPF